MRRKLRNEIREIIEERIDTLRHGLYSSDIKHRIYGGVDPWPGLYSVETHSMSDVLKAILDHCELELDYTVRKEEVVVKKKEKEKPPVVYKKSVVGKK